MQVRKGWTASVLGSALGCAALLAAPARAQSWSEGHGVDSIRLLRIDSLLRGYVDAGQLPGAVALVLRDGTPIYSAAVGWQDREAQAPMTSATLFRIASMTKPITAVAVLMLMEQGRLVPSDPVGKFLPELAHLRVIAEPGGDPSQTVPAARPITLEHLLTHTSGLSYGFTSDPLDSLYRARGVASGLVPVEGTEADNIKRIATLPLAHQPGEAWRYGVSYDVLGRVVEVVSHQDLATFFRERIFLPLGMTSTYFEVAPAEEHRLAGAYTASADGHLRPIGRNERVGLVAIGSTANVERPLRYYSGGGNLVSTAGDYARFLEMLRRGGELDGVRLLSPKTVELMVTDHITHLPGAVTPGAGFGLSVEVVRDLGRWGTPGSVGSFRWGGIYGTSFWVDPKERISAVFFFQRFPRTGMSPADAFRIAVYQALVR